MNMNREAITVSALNRYVKTLLENDEVLSNVWVEGELSDVHIHLQSGHIYFRLIEQLAELCVFHDGMAYESLCHNVFPLCINGSTRAGVEF